MRRAPLWSFIPFFITFLVSMGGFWIATRWSVGLGTIVMGIGVLGFGSLPLIWERQNRQHAHQADGVVIAYEKDYAISMMTPRHGSPLCALHPRMEKRSRSKMAIPADRSLSRSPQKSRFSMTLAIHRTPSSTASWRPALPPFLPPTGSHHLLP
jgi:hypothetical protein